MKITIEALRLRLGRVLTEAEEVVEVMRRGRVIGVFVPSGVSVASGSCMLCGGKGEKAYGDGMMEVESGVGKVAVNEAMAKFIEGSVKEEVGVKEVEQGVGCAKCGRGGELRSKWEEGEEFRVCDWCWRGVKRP